MNGSSDCECVIVVLLAVVVLYWVAKPLLNKNRSEGMRGTIINGNDSNNSNVMLRADQIKYPPNQGSVPAYNNCSKEIGMYSDRSEPSLVDASNIWGRQGVGARWEDVIGYIPGNYYFLDTGMGDVNSVGSVVSPLCCGNQYDTPFDVESDPYILANKDKFVKSRYFGNNSTADAGCLCLNKDQATLISNRGTNPV